MSEEPDELLRVVRALRDMGAMRVRVGDVDVLFAAPGIPDDAAELAAERERERREREERMDAEWSA